MSLEYYGVPLKYIQEFCKACPTCEKAQPQTYRAPLKPIVEEEFLHRIQVDLIDMRHSPDGEFNYICHIVDHFSKYHILSALNTKSAVEVASVLEEKVLAYLGTPRIFHSDNGREFINQVLR